MLLTNTFGPCECCSVDTPGVSLCLTYIEVVMLFGGTTLYWMVPFQHYHSMAFACMYYYAGNCLRVLLPIDDFFTFSSLF